MTLTINQEQYVQTYWQPGSPSKVEIRHEKQIIVDGINFDLRALPVGETRSTPWGRWALGWRGDLTVDSAGNATFLLVTTVRTGQTPHSPISTTIDLSALPNYFKWPDGETQAPQTITEQANNNYFADAEFRKDQTAAIASIKAWRAQKKAWMLDAAGYEDLASGKEGNLIDKVGQWLKSADAAIKLAYQDPNVSPADVKKIADLAVMGAADITSVEQYMQSVYLHDSPPTVPMLWVSKTDPVRLNVANVEQYGNENILDHNTLDETWMVVNQPGTVTLDDTTPIVGTAITATVTDPDGGIGNIEYQWQKKNNAQGNWYDAVGETLQTMTPLQQDAGRFTRCQVKYTDNANANTSAKNTATSAETEAIAAS